MSAAQADVISYNAAISACEKASEWQASLATLFELLGWVKFLLWPVCVCVCVCAGMRSVFAKIMLLLYYISCSICRPSWSVLSMITNSNLSPLKSKGTAKQWKRLVPSCWIQLAIEPLRMETSSRILPDTVSFNTALSACDEAGLKGLCEYFGFMVDFLASLTTKCQYLMIICMPTPEHCKSHEPSKACLTGWPTVTTVAVGCSRGLSHIILFSSLPKKRQESLCRLAVGKLHCSCFTQWRCLLAKGSEHFLCWRLYVEYVWICRLNGARRAARIYVGGGGKFVLRVSRRIPTTCPGWVLARVECTKSV